MCFFDCLHDLGDPADVADERWTSPAPDSHFIVFARHSSQVTR